MIRFKVLAIGVVASCGLGACQDHGGFSAGRDEDSGRGFGLGLDQRGADRIMFSGQHEIPGLEPVEINDALRVLKQQYGRNDIVINDAQARREQAHVVIELAAGSGKRFTLNVDQGLMSATVRVRHSEGPWEEYQVQGSFDKTKPIWEAELEAVDPRIREKNVVLVKALCVEGHVCNPMAMDVYFRSQGLVFKRQFQTNVSKPQIARGDGPGAPIYLEVESTELQTTEPSGRGRRLVLRRSQAEGAQSESVESSKDARSSSGPKPESKEPASRSVFERLRGIFTVSKPGSPKGSEQQSASAPAADRLLLNRSADLLAEAPVEYQGEIHIPRPSNPVFRTEDQNDRSRGARRSSPIQPSELSGGSENKEGRISQARRYHTGGRLVGSDLFPVQGKGFLRVAANGGNPEVGSVWTTALSARVIAGIGGEFERLLPSRKLFVSALSARYGGSIGSHASHQNGLDVDIHYQRVSRKNEAFVAIKGGRLDPEFDLQSNWTLFKLFANHPESATMVIFTDRVIKREMCRFAAQSGEDIKNPESEAYRALRVLMHWDRHQDHFHVRFRCPRDSQEGLGCGETLVTLPNGTGC